MHTLAVRSLKKLQALQCGHHKIGSCAGNRFSCSGDPVWKQEISTSMWFSMPFTAMPGDKGVHRPPSPCAFFIHPARSLVSQGCVIESSGRSSLCWVFEV